MMFQMVPFGCEKQQREWAEYKCPGIVVFIYYYAHLAFSPVAQDRAAENSSML